MLTIAIVDDAEKWLLIAEKLVNAMPGCKVIVKLYDGIEFVEWCYRNRNLPDIALIDVEMRKMDGVQTVDFFTDHFPAIKLMAISSHTHKEAVEDMVACGACGYVSKLYNMKNLPDAINAVAAGKIYIDPILQIENIDREKLMAVRAKQKEYRDDLGLKPKQTEMNALYATVASQKHIADILSVSEKTVEYWVKKISLIL